MKHAYHERIKPITEVRASLKQLEQLIRAERKEKDKLQKAGRCLILYLRLLGEGKPIDEELLKQVTAALALFQKD